MSDRICLRNVKGHHADGNKISSANVEAEVVEDSHRVLICIADEENPDFFLELVLEVEQ